MMTKSKNNKAHTWKRLATKIKKVASKILKRKDFKDLKRITLRRANKRNKLQSKLLWSAKIPGNKTTNSVKYKIANVLLPVSLLRFTRISNSNTVTKSYNRASKPAPMFQVVKVWSKR